MIIAVTVLCYDCSEVLQQPQPVLLKQGFATLRVLNLSPDVLMRITIGILEKSSIPRLKHFNN